MRTIMIVSTFALASLNAHAQSGAENYPNRPLRLIIPMSAGGATDIFIRTIIPKLSETLGQQVVVDNRAGANGIIGEELKNIKFECLRCV